MDWVQLQSPPADMEHIISRIQQSGRNRFQRNVMLASLSALIYVIWSCRNLAYWEQYIRRIDISVKQVKDHTRARVMVVLPKKITRSDY